MKRQYQFSVDSFQIYLDPLLTRKFDGHFPPIFVLSSYGHFSEAVQHLHYRLIAVKAPEELRGGGLLKYCDLVARGFRPTNQLYMKDLQRYMCSRFFIDFRDSLTQEQILFKYVISHFGTDYDVRYRFLRCLYEVISTDSVWLSAFERICFLKNYFNDDFIINTTENDELWLVIEDPGSFFEGGGRLIAEKIESLYRIHSPRRWEPSLVLGFTCGY